MNIDFGGIAVDKAFMQAGVNDNVFLESLTYESADTGNSVLIKFSSDSGATIQDKIFEPNDRFKGDLSSEEHIQRQVNSINSKLRSILTNYVSEEDIVKKFTETKPTSFKDVIKIYEGLVPSNSRDLKGRLFCWYKSNGYLEVPKFTYATKGNRLFTLNPDVDLEVNPRYSDRMNKPERAEKPEIDF